MTILRCDRCNSTNFRRAGYKLLSERKIQQYQCKDCGKIFWSREGLGEEALPVVREPRRQYHPEKAG
jgi:hypothetical protein